MNQFKRTAAIAFARMRERERLCYIEFQRRLSADFAGDYLPRAAGAAPGNEQSRRKLRRKRETKHAAMGSGRVVRERNRARFFARTDNSFAKASARTAREDFCDFQRNGRRQRSHVHDHVRAAGRRV